MQASHFAVIPAEKCQHILGQVILVLGFQRANDAAVDRNVARVLGVGNVDKYVAGVHVRVEKRVAEDLGKKDLDAPSG